MKLINSNEPHLRFYLETIKEIPMSLMSRESYDELNSYEPMMYRPEKWESFHKHQILHMDYYNHQLETVGCINQVGKIAVLNNDDFLSRKGEVESKDGFVKWF
jgi:hypothetical protein